MSTGVTTLDRIKVYFCGQPEAGKTTLSRALANDKLVLPDETNPLKLRTRGIDVSRVKLSDGTECSFWDFAGQGDYHVHHDLFMSHDASLFVVLIDARQSEADRKRHATYWLQYIVTQCPAGSRPNVLLLASHADEASQIPMPDQIGLEVYIALLYYELIEVFGDVVTFVRADIQLINCSDISTTELQMLTGTISDVNRLYKEQSSHAAPLICKQMLDVLVPLRETDRTHFLTWSQVIGVMSNVSKDSSMLKLAMKHLHKIGEVFYDDHGSLGEIVIIDLPWLCHEVLGWLFCPVEMLTAHNMARMVRFRSLAESGPVYKADIPVVNLFENTQIETIDVIEAFDLCASIMDGEQKVYIFPTLLKSTPPDDMWQPRPDYEVNIGLRFTCSSEATMIPPGYFGRLQIMCLRDFEILASLIAARSIWSNSMIFSYAGVDVRIWLSENHRSIYVNVRGKSEGKRTCRKVLHCVVAAVDSCLSQSPGLMINVGFCESADLKKCAQEPFCFEAENVLAARRKGNNIVMTTDGHASFTSDVLALGPPCKCFYLLVTLISPLTHHRL